MGNDAFTALTHLRFFGFFHKIFLVSNLLCSICVARPRLSTGSYCALCAKAYNKLYRDHHRANPTSNVNSKPCTKCGVGVRIPGQRWCLDCDREYRKVNSKHRQQIKSNDARLKSRTRAITRKLIQSGQLVKQPCQFCGKEDVEAHHPDYSKPEYVWWVCRWCHKWEVHGGHI